MERPKNLRAISIMNPFAWLIAKNWKDQEFRSWDTKFRGLVLLHVSASREYEADFQEFLESGDVTQDEIKAMRSAIIGFAFVTGTTQHGEDDFGHWMSGPAMLKKPIPTPGALNYWQPQRNRPRQESAFQEAWKQIYENDYIAVEPDTTDYCMTQFGIDTKPRQILIPPPPGRA